MSNLKIKHDLLPGEEVKGKIVLLYASVTNEDKTEGRGKQIDDDYFIDRDSAIIGASGIGVMGTDGKVEPRTALQTETNRFYLLFEITVSKGPANIEELRANALKKLSPSERVALGIKE